jgi:hypothetical protein
MPAGGQTTLRTKLSSLGNALTRPLPSVTIQLFSALSIAIVLIRLAVLVTLPPWPISGVSGTCRCLKLWAVSTLRTSNRRRSLSNDLEATWASVLYNLEATNTMANVSQIGHYNDPDMLQVSVNIALSTTLAAHATFIKVGNVGLSYDEASSHFAMWCMVNAPLLIGADLVGLRNRPEYLSILLNQDLIDLNQDALGFQGRRVGEANPTGVELWFKTLADGSVAAALLNKGEVVQTGTIDFSKVRPIVT